MVFIWSLHFEEFSPGVIVNCEFVFLNFLEQFPFQTVAGLNLS
jgi:hypothetical protein